MTRISNDHVRELAREQYSSSVDIEFDGDAEVAFSTDKVAYVAAWLAVDIDELTHPELHEPRPPRSRGVFRPGAPASEVRGPS